MKNKSQTGLRNCKPKINLNHNIYCTSIDLHRILETSLPLQFSHPTEIAVPTLERTVNKKQNDM